MTGCFTNLLVISLQGIGDLLLVTPLLHGLKIAYPGSRLTVLTLETNTDVLNSNPDVDQVIIFKGVHKNNIFKILNIILKIRCEHFDLAICAYPSGLRSAFIAYLSGAKERLGQGLSLFNNYRWLFTRQVPITEVKHAVLLNLDFLGILGVNGDDIPKAPTLKLSDEDKKFASDLMRSAGINTADLVVAIHAGGGNDRSWPKERFAEVADTLIEKNKVKVIFVGSRRESLLVEHIQGIMKGRSASFAGKTSLLQMGALLQNSKLLICNNSGPMHIAAALGIPTISFAGPVDPRIHGPWGKGHIILQSSFECRPCYYPFFRDTIKETEQRNRWFGKTFRCKTNDYRCLTDIGASEVLKTADKILGSG